METTGIDFSLVRGATFAGTIRHASGGQPVSSVEVTIQSSTGTVVDHPYTALNGQYRSRALPAGTYYASARNYYNYNGGQTVDQVYNNHNCPPEGCDWHTGDPIELVTGTDTTGIDFSLHDYGDDCGDPPG